MTDHTKLRKKESPGGPKDNPAIQLPPISDSKGDKKTYGNILQSYPQTQQAAANQRVPRSPSSNSLRAGSLIDIFGSNPTSKPITHDFAVIAMVMSARLNSDENGLFCSPRLRDQREMDEPRKRDAIQVKTKGTSAATKVAFVLFSMFALATSTRMPNHQINPDATYTKQVLNRFHEVNELYDGALNEVYHLMYSADITTNECFAFRNAMKQEDKMSFVDAMEKEILDHKNGEHWSIVHRNTPPNKARPIKTIWISLAFEIPNGFDGPFFVGEGIAMDY